MCSVSTDLAGLKYVSLSSTHSTVTLFCQFGEFHDSIWYDIISGRDHNHCVNLLPADYYVPICSSGQQPWQLWNNLPVKLTNYFSATEDKRINSHHLTEQEPNAPDISKLPLNGIFFWMQIMTKVCSVMNWSFYQFFHGKQFVLECTMFVPMDFYERSHLRFHMKPPPHLPLVRDKDGRLINI